MLRNAKIRDAIGEACQQLELGPERWAKVLDNAMNAEIELVTGPGETVKQPDHRIRLKAVALTAKLLVITSYSIHYTKLYDSTSRRSSSSPAQAVSRNAFR